MNQNVKIRNLIAASGKEYGINQIEKGGSQYMDRDYLFNWIPDELSGSTHILTCGNDKLIDENDLCLSFEVDEPVDVYILFADKFPIIPGWLKEYKRLRLNITRDDSDPSNLRGYFGVYMKSFDEGKIELNGCSPSSFLKKEWFVESLGFTYCMYTVVLKKMR